MPPAIIYLKRARTPHKSMHSCSLIFAGLVASASVTFAAEPTPEQAQFFESKVRPVLSSKCYKCHAVEQGKSKGGLTLDTREGLFKGGETGPAVAPGKMDSLLLTAISYKDADLQMPPKGEKLSDQEIADLTAWVKMGAPDPRKADASKKLTGLTDKARAHWAYQPVKKPVIPTVKNRAWCITPVDAFVMEKLESKQMAPSPPAGREALLRRATYDLLGLPPTPAEIDAFTTDQAPDNFAFAKVVDRLLASPQYGERWGRFWLDTARYSDTTGQRDERGADYRFPYAYTFRDWVVKSFNDDLPYDQFILQQLAADKLPNNKPENLAALGLITIGERFPNRNDVINDQIDTVSKGFLAMTVACARCHDHMFDPIPTKDYYAMHGIFASTVEPAEKPLLAGKPIDPKLKADFESKVAAVEQDNRDKYYKVIEDFSFMFRQKAAAYITAAHLGQRDASEENQQKADALATEEKLDRNLVNEIRNRLRNKDHEVFGPFARLTAAGDGWKETTAKLATEKRFNPLIVAAIKESSPQSWEQLAEIYGKIFLSVDTKAKDVIKAYAGAKTMPVAVGKADTETNGKNAVPEMMQASMTMGMMSGDVNDAKAGTVAGIEGGLARLAVTPFRIQPAYELNSDALRAAVQQWPLQIQGRARFDFAKINELLMTHDGVEKRAMAVKDAPKAKDSPVFIRGQAGVPGDVVPRRFLEVLSNGHPQPFRLGSGRLELAQAIASKSNPLTARVVVNRVWMHHFGQGFVRTPDDLGTMSEAPSHPELLDYLSWWFMEQGWSMKKLHKLVMLSQAYQMTSKVNAETKKTFAVMDPENRLLWRANIRRLDFESMRDSLLAMSGRLDRTVGGQPVNLTEEPYSYRRSVYGYVDRGNVPELMSNFDFSNPSMTNSARTTTIVPQQALFLMNSPMAVDVARRIVARPEFQREGIAINRLNAVYKIVLGRAPAAKEVELAYKFIADETRKQPEVMAAMSDISKKAQEQAQTRAMERANRSDAIKAIQNEGEIIARAPLDAWQTYAQALLFSNEAAYIN